MNTSGTCWKNHSMLVVGRSFRKICETYHSNSLIILDKEDEKE